MMRCVRFSERCYLRVLQALFTVRTHVSLVDSILIMFDCFLFPLSDEHVSNALFSSVVLVCVFG